MLVDYSAWPAEYALLEVFQLWPALILVLLVQGISSLATGIGPIFFAALFSAVTRTDSSLPYMPYIVWYVAAGMTAVAILLTISLARERESITPSATASPHPSSGGAPAGPPAQHNSQHDDARVVVQARPAKSRATPGSNDDNSIKAPLLAGEEAA
jgi:hypothetical protein